MKLLIGNPFDIWRATGPDIVKHFGSVGNASCGVFRIKTQHAILSIIAASSEGWDHVSISVKDRCPTWNEMVFVKRAFFKEDEWALEFHPPEDLSINVHPNCLHLWRPHGPMQYPTPPVHLIQ